MDLERPRIRAAKACKRCSQRKIKCDAVQNGLPCSRCRMDHVYGCALTMSRRGTYDRKAARQRIENESPLTRQSERPLNHIPNNQEVEAAAATPFSVQESDLASFTTDFDHTEHPLSYRDAASSMPPLEPNITAPEPRATVSSTPTTSTARSVSAMFEDFLSWRTEKSIPQCGLILLGEPSPLTFALQELPQGACPPLHDASDEVRDSTNLTVIRQDIHPSHLDAADIAYLKAKGAFSSPPRPLMNSLVEAYLTRFHPLYSIVNKLELEKVHNELKTPWLLLHAVCFIGATFCDSSIIHRSNLKSRLDARRHYYQNAKLLFDFGYETNKVILAQCAIMLSFWGPQMHSHWNPCSWVSFGVTFAVSLGIHRSAASSNAPRGDKGLLRRLWWALVVRDTYCSALLGRPFRINLTQCDTEILKMDDFVHETAEGGFYQVQITRLSLLLRDIIHSRFGPGGQTITPEDVRSKIEEWHTDLQQSIQRAPDGGVSFTCSIALELLYNYFLLLLYIKKPARQGNPRQHRSEQPPGGIVESCARTIASHAITLVTKTNICDLPHELFPAFFVAGIVLYRQMQQQNELVSQMARANLDNCRIVLNETKELWDPGKWAMEIFDFLCANHKEMAPTLAASLQGNQKSNTLSHTNSTDHQIRLEKQQAHMELDNEPSFGGSSDGNYSHFTGRMEDLLLMPNFLPPATDEWPGFHF